MIRRQHEKEQNGQRNCGDAMAANCAITCRPREHQDIKNRHELIGPKQPGEPESQRKLDDYRKNQMVRRTIEVSNDHVSLYVFGEVSLAPAILGSKISFGQCSFD